MARTKTSKHFGCLTAACAKPGIEIDKFVNVVTLVQLVKVYQYVACVLDFDRFLKMCLFVKCCLQLVKCCQHLSNFKELQIVINF